MSTDLYGIRILEIKSKEKKIKVKVFVVYYDIAFKTHQPIPKDPSFFLRILCANGGRIRKEYSIYDTADERWVDKNTFKFIKEVELLDTANFPVEDYSSYHDFYYERDGSWENEDKLVQASYEIEVTDKKYIDHLSPNMSWGTAAYESNALVRRHTDEVFSILESAYDKISVLVNESEEILSPLFKNDYNLEEAQDIMISLFEKQRKSVDFKAWVEILTKHLESDSFPDNARYALDDIIFFLDEVFFKVFHEKLSENLDRNNLNSLINHLQDECKPVTNSLQIENPSQDAEVNEIQSFALRFIGQIKESFIDMEGVIDGLADKLDY